MTLVLLVGQDDAGAGLFGGFLALICLFWAIGLAAEVFWLWMLIDALANEPTTK